VVVISATRTPCCSTGRTGVVVVETKLTLLDIDALLVKTAVKGGSVIEAIESE
jgi:hypothetical protein